MKKVLAFSCIVALSAILAGCNKDGSRNAADAAGASGASGAAAASEAPTQAVTGASATLAASGAQAANPVGTITRTQLPKEAADTLRLIKAGGPFPYKEDGVLFRNSSAMLPAHPRGYYRAYTVRTPDSTDRGQRRIVCGGARKQTTECYYTEDYYVNFKHIAE